jgi:hypothetical protein
VLSTIDTRPALAAIDPKRILAPRGRSDRKAGKRWSRATSNEQNQGTGGATAGGWSKMSDEPLAREREPIERVRARLEALVMANAAPRCGARSKRTREAAIHLRSARGCR